MPFRPIVSRVVTLLIAGACLSAQAGEARYSPALWGSDSDAARCVVCHSLEKGGEQRVAPNLWGIVGAPKARYSAWYAYSPGLIKRGGVWTEEDLDKFLEDANAFSPGSTKSIRVVDAAERKKIIDFLKTLHD